MIVSYVLSVCLRNPRDGKYTGNGERERERERERGKN